MPAARAPPSPELPLTRSPLAVENQCKAQLLVEAALAGGQLTKRVIDDEDASFTAATIQFWENTYINFQPEFELLKEERGDKFLK